MAKWASAFKLSRGSSECISTAADLDKFRTQNNWLDPKISSRVALALHSLNEMGEL